MAIYICALCVNSFRLLDGIRGRSWLTRQLCTKWLFAREPTSNWVTAIFLMVNVYKWLYIVKLIRTWTNSIWKCLVEDVFVRFKAILKCVTSTSFGWCCPSSEGFLRIVWSWSWHLAAACIQFIKWWSGSNSEARRLLLIVACHGYAWFEIVEFVNEVYVRLHKLSWTLRKRIELFRFRSIQLTCTRKCPFLLSASSFGYNGSWT